MQQLSGSSGRGGTQTPATKVLLRWISLRRSSGEESREENRIEGPESSVDSLSDEVDMPGSLAAEEAVVGGLLSGFWVEASRIEA
jgi:hypothetical protein